jgi:hypothetical protein
MSSDSSSVGRTIVDGEIPRDASPEVAMAAADRIFTSLGARLGRWVGSDAFDTLLQRARASTRSDHPLLDRVLSAGAAGLAGQDPAVEGVTTQGVRDATAATLDALATLLGRFVGEDLAARLVLQDWRTPVPDAEPERKP